MLDNNIFYGVSFKYKLMYKWYSFCIYLKSESEVDECLKLFRRHCDLYKDYNVNELHFDLSFETLKKLTGKK